MKKLWLLATGIILLTLAAGSTSAFAGISGIIAQGNFSVYKAGKLKNKMSGITPVTEESLLVCEGKCLVKTKGVSLIIQDGTELAVKKDQEQFNLLVMNGQVDFSLTDQAGKVAFYTADGQYTVGDAMFNASTSDAVRGYMQTLEEGQAKIGLHEGRMVFSTGEGPKTINSEEYILLAQAGAAAAAASASAGGAGASASAAAAAAGAGGAASAAATASAVTWGGFGAGTLFTACTVITVTTVTTTSKSKGTSASNKGGSINQITTITGLGGKSTTGTTKSRTRIVNKTKIINRTAGKGSVKGSSKGSKGSKGKGSRGSRRTTSTTTTTTIITNTNVTIGCGGAASCSN